MRTWFLLCISLFDISIDHEGNVTAQIAYSSHSTRWTFPSEFYTQSFTSSDGVTLDLIMIDTSKYLLQIIFAYLYTQFFCNIIFVVIHLLYVSVVDVAGSITVSEDHPDYFNPTPGTKSCFLGEGLDLAWRSNESVYCDVSTRRWSLSCVLCLWTR